MSYKIISEVTQAQEDDISSISQHDSENYEDRELNQQIYQSEEQDSFEMDYQQMKSKGIKFVAPLIKPQMIQAIEIKDQTKLKQSNKEKENYLPLNQIKRPISAIPKPILKNKSTHENIITLPEQTGSLSQQDYKPVYKLPYNNFLQKSKQFNYSQKNFNTLVRKSDRVARYLEMNQTWKQSSFLKSNSNIGNGGTKQGRKLNLEDRIKYQKQCQRDQGIFYKNVTKSELFL